MRMLGTLPTEAEAALFADYLLTLAIRTQVEAEGSGWAVWVIDEDKVERGRQELSAFQANPADARYQSAVDEARRLRAQERSRPASRIVNLRDRWVTPQGTQPLTAVLMAVSLLASVGTNFTHSQFQAVDRLMLSAPVRTVDDLLLRAGEGPLAEVRRGEVWRLVTPIFMHVGWFHLIGNLLMVHFLGTLIEFRIGTWRATLLVLLVAVLSNLGQYEWNLLRESDHPGYFCGLSGVGYGLFGYAWVKGRFDPAAAIGVDQRTTMYMILWLFACMTGVIGPVANAAHVAGLIAGGLLALARV